MDTYTEITAEKIYQEVEIIWKKLISFRAFPEKEDEEKFRKTMHGKKFGAFVSVLQNNAGILYLKIGDYKMENACDPGYKHIEKIKKFLAKCKDWQVVSREIFAQLTCIPAYARRIHLLTLYPEIDALEKENEKLKGENTYMRKSYGREKALEIILDQKTEKIRKLTEAIEIAIMFLSQQNPENISQARKDLIKALPPETQAKFIGIQPSGPWPK